MGFVKILLLFNPILVKYISIPKKSFSFFKTIPRRTSQQLLNQRFRSFPLFFFSHVDGLEAKDFPIFCWRFPWMIHQRCPTKISCFFHKTADIFRIDLSKSFCCQISGWRSTNSKHPYDQHDFAPVDMTIYYFCWLHPRKLTWHPKIDTWKRSFLLETIILRFHVSFRECKSPDSSIINRRTNCSPE